MEVNEKTKVTTDLKTIWILAIMLFSLLFTYFNLQAQIDKAMKEPKPEVTRVELDLNNSTIRKEIMNNRLLIEKNFEKLEIIEQRIYELK